MKLLKFLPKLRKPKVRRVIGSSMLPTIQKGQLVVAFGAGYRLGDVVIAILKNREVIKRVIKIEAGMVWLEGDNAEASTDSRTLGPVPHDAVKGKVIWPKKLRKD